MLRSIGNAFPQPLNLADAPPFPPLEAYDTTTRAGAEGQQTSISAHPYHWREPASMPRRDWIYGRQLLRGSLFTIIAPGATGKTTWMTGTALALVTGRSLLGQTVWSGPKRVWLWNLEDPKREVEYSIQAAAKHWEIGEADIGGGLFVNIGLEGDLLRLAQQTPTGPQLNTETMNALEEELRSRQIDVFMIDPLISAHGLPGENDNVAMDMVAKGLARISNAAGCATVLAHHAQKLNGAEVTVESSRGASSLTDAARGGLALNQMSEADAQKFGIDSDAKRRFFRADDAKPNRAPPGKATWFEIVSVQLGNAPDGGDGVGVAVPWRAPDPFDNVSLADLRRVQSRIDERGWRESSQAKDWFGILVADVLELDLGSAAEKRKVKTIVSTWIKNGAFAISERQDERRQTRKFIILGELA